MEDVEVGDAQVLIAGLPASGKTTFLAALWHLVANSEDSRFSVHEFLGDREYVQGLERTWLAAKEMPRTPTRERRAVLLNVIDRISGDRFRVSLPDLSGELFADSFARRDWPLEFAEIVDQSSGILLFVNPEAVVRPTTLMDADALAKLIGDEGPLGQPPNEPIVEWDPTRAPTATILVDFLRSVVRRRAAASPMRVAVVVSAWDTIRGPGVLPETWMQQNLSMLYQYLLTNPSLFQSRVFGVSAQGGDVNDPNVRRQLLAIEPVDRICVTEDLRETNDLTIALLWATARAL